MMMMLFTVDAQADDVFPLDFADGIHCFEHAHELRSAHDLQAELGRLLKRPRQQVDVRCHETMNVFGRCRFDGLTWIRRDRWTVVPWQLP